MSIKQLRARLGLTQAELAELVGVHWTTVSRWENGHTEPRGAARMLLLKAGWRP